MELRSRNRRYAERNAALELGAQDAAADATVASCSQFVTQSLELLVESPVWKVRANNKAFRRVSGYPEPSRILHSLT